MWGVRISGALLHHLLHGLFMLIGHIGQFLQRFAVRNKCLSDRYRDDNALIAMTPFVRFRSSYALDTNAASPRSPFRMGTA